MEQCFNSLSTNSDKILKQTKKHVCSLNNLKGQSTYLKWDSVEIAINLCQGWKTDIMERETIFLLKLLKGHIALHTYPSVIKLTFIYFVYMSI